MGGRVKDEQEQSIRQGEYELSYRTVYNEQYSTGR